MLLGVGHGTGKKRPRDTLPAMLRRNDEADDRPDGLIVDGLHNGRACQPRILFSRSDRNPTDGHLVPIANQSGRSSGFHEPFELSPVYFSSCGARWWQCLGAAQPIGHAPATSSDRAALGFEDRVEVDPAFWREGQDGELHVVLKPQKIIEPIPSRVGVETNRPIHESSCSITSSCSTIDLNSAIDARGLSFTCGSHCF